MGVKIPRRPAATRLSAATLSTSEIANDPLGTARTRSRTRRVPVVILRPRGVRGRLFSVRALPSSGRYHGVGGSASRARSRASIPSNPAAKQGDLLAQALDMPDFSRSDFTGCRNPVPAVRIGRRVSAFPRCSVSGCRTSSRCPSRLRIWRDLFIAFHGPPVSLENWRHRFKSSIGRRGALTRRPVDHDHAVIVDRLPVPVGGGSVLGVGPVANPAVSIHLPAVKRALQPVSLDPAMGKVRTLVRAERLHGRDPALSDCETGRSARPGTGHA